MRRAGITLGRPPADRILRQSTFVDFCRECDGCVNGLCRGVAVGSIRLRGKGSFCQGFSPVRLAAVLVLVLMLLMVSPPARAEAVHEREAPRLIEIVDEIATVIGEQSRQNLYLYSGGIAILLILLLVARRTVRRKRDRSQRGGLTDTTTTLPVAGMWTDDNSTQPPAMTREAADDIPDVPRAWAEAYGTGGQSSLSSLATVDPVVLAETLTEMGAYEPAIVLLTRHIRETERPAPPAWLVLFDLYARTQRFRQYTALAEGFHALFNAAAPSWDALHTEQHKQLEDYPELIGKVQRLWGLPTCRAFLESLLYDDRGGVRQGFMINAYRDILLLIEVIDGLAEMKAEEDHARGLALRQASMSTGRT